MFCSSCGTATPEHFNYCPTDGAVLKPGAGNGTTSKREFCNACGSRAHTGDEYCQACGHHLSGITWQKEKISLKIPAVSKGTSGGALPKVEATGFFSSFNLRNGLIAGATAILLMLVISFGIRTALISSISETLQDDMKATEAIAAMITEGIMESGIDSDEIPQISLTSMILLAINDVNPIATMEAMGQKGTVKFSNLATLFSFIPIIVFAISGAVLGYLAKRSRTSIWQPLLIGSVAYGIFLFLNKLVAGIKIGGGDEDFLLAKLSFGLMDTVVAGLAMPLLVAGVTAYLLFYGKEIVEYLAQKNQYLQYLIGSWVLYLAGTLMVTFTTLLAVEDGVKDAIAASFDDLPESGGLLMFGGALLGLAHLNPMKLGEDTPMLFLFSGKDSDLSWVYWIIGSKDALPLQMKLSFIIPLILLTALGYVLYRSHQLKWQQILAFAGVYSVMITGLSYFNSFAISMNMGSESQKIAFGISPSYGLFITFIFATICFTAGGFLRRKLEN